jgi:hypothetical protein
MEHANAVDTTSNNITEWHTSYNRTHCLNWFTARKKNATTPSNNHTVSFVENERILQWLLEILGSLVDL